MGKFYYNRWVVLATLFLVAGPFGFPLLWRSSQFSRRAKWVLTVLVLVYTVGLIVGSGVAFQQFLKRMQELEASLR